MHHYASTLIRVSIIALCLALAWAPPAFSQSAAPQRPSGGGLFGATRSDISASNKLNFTFEIAEGFDSELPVDVLVAPFGGVATGGFLTWLAASSEYARRHPRFEVAATGSTAFRYQQKLDRLDALSHSAGLGVKVRLPKRGSVQITQAAAYSPSYLYQLFPETDAPVLGASIPSHPEYQIDQLDSYSYSTRAAMAFGSERGTQLTALADYAGTHFDGDTSTHRDVENRSVSGALSRAVSRSASVVLGYGYRTGEFDLAGRVHEHRTTIGLNYSAALSRSRRLVIGLNAGPGWFTVSEFSSDPSTAAQANRYQYSLVGDASVTYPFRLNWTSAISYSRDGVQNVPGLSRPLFSDAVRAQITALISHRLDVAASAGYVAGRSTLDADQTLDTYTASARVRYALKRSFALYGEYLYYSYDQRGQPILPADLPAVFEQHGLRIGLTLFVEAIGRR